MAPYTSLPKKVIIVNSFHFKAISTITYIHRIDVTLVHVFKKVCKFIQHVCTNSSSTQLLMSCVNIHLSDSNITTNVNLTKKSFPGLFGELHSYYYFSQFMKVGSPTIQSESFQSISTSNSTRQLHDIGQFKRYYIYRLLEVFQF